MHLQEGGLLPAGGLLRVPPGAVHEERDEVRPLWLPVYRRGDGLPDGEGGGEEVASGGAVRESLLVLSGALWKTKEDRGPVAPSLLLHSRTDGGERATLSRGPPPQRVPSGAYGGLSRRVSGNAGGRREEAKCGDEMRGEMRRADERDVRKRKGSEREGEASIHADFADIPRHASARPHRGRSRTGSIRTPPLSRTVTRSCSIEARNRPRVVITRV